MRVLGFKTTDLRPAVQNYHPSSLGKNANANKHISQNVELFLLTFSFKGLNQDGYRIYNISTTCMNSPSHLIMHLV